MSRILLIIAIITLNNCASVRNPEGGPVDEIPPTLVSTNPQTLTSITPKQKVTIRFSEYLKESSIKNSIQVVRIMPNMPALIGEGISCLVSNNYFSKTNKIKLLSNLFQSINNCFHLLLFFLV